MKPNYLKFDQISGRYITLDDVNNFIETLNPNLFEIETKELSVEQRELKSICFGKGTKKVLMWSQMHGNEGTTTKAVFDWLHELNTNTTYYEYISTHYTICVLPMVNPDGSFYYQRENANKVDLNRDAYLLTQPESQFLRKWLVDFKPDLALNLHDQRTIFGVGDTKYPATVSFLAPAFNEQRDVNEVREIAMKLIVAMKKDLEQKIPNQIGRFDDSFNINCIGDYVTSIGVPTILFEAGHYSGDYSREVTRSLIADALFCLFDEFVDEKFSRFSLDEYWHIGENQKTFNDISVVDFDYANENLIKNGAIYVQYIEKKQNNKMIFDYSLDFEQAPNAKYAHKILNAKGLKFNSTEELFCFLDENIQKPQ